MADLVTRRLHNQLLVHPRFDTPDAVVAWMGAVQAQEYPLAKWGLGLRLQDATDTAIEQAVNAGTILRTHVMRPTWHFVTPADIRWLLALTAPRVHAAMAYNYRRLGLDAALFLQSDTVLAKALEGGRELTRPELAAALNQAGIATEGLRLSHLVMHAELEGVICSGARRGKHFTYALLDDRVPQTKPLDRDEALAELALRYFTSHGPATVRDCAWWSGLTQADVKAGLALVEGQLEQEVIDGTAYWHAGTPAAGGRLAATALLLPAFDEYTVGYKDRAAILNPDYAGQMGSAVLDNVFVYEGRAIGRWAGRADKGRLAVQPAPFEPWNTAQQDAFAAAAQRYGKFLDMPVTLV